MNIIELNRKKSGKRFDALETKKNNKKTKKRQHTLSSGIKLQSASEFKRQTFYALENPNKGNRLSEFIGYLLFVLILANAIVVFFSYQPGADPIASNIITGFYAFSTGCFFVEYIARIWIADLLYGRGTRLQARIKYILSPLGIIDFLSFAPNIVTWFFPITPALQAIVNVARIMRLIKVSRYMRGLRTIGRVLSKQRHEILAAFLVLGLLIIVSSVVMYELEHQAQPTKFNNLLSGVYWAVTTVTGTGYGDLVPITPLGRIAGSIIMILSVGLVAIPGGIFAAGFVAEYQNANYRKIERDIKTNSRANEHDMVASTGSSDASNDREGSEDPRRSDPSKDDGSGDARDHDDSAS